MKVATLINRRIIRIILLSGLFAVFAGPVVIPAAAYANGCTLSGVFVACDATVSNVSVTIVCPGTNRPATGKLGSMNATEFAGSIAEAQTRAQATAQREATRVAGERALANCNGTVVNPGGATTSTKVGGLENGSCGIEGAFVACQAVARNVAVTATCPAKKRSVARTVASVTATDYGKSIAEAQAKARDAAVREAERVARERALAALSCG